MVPHNENVKQVFSYGKTQQIAQFWIFCSHSTMYSRP